MKHIKLFENYTPYTIFFNDFINILYQNIH